MTLYKGLGGGGYSGEMRVVKTILLVDDDYKYSAMLNHVLSRTGYYVIPAFEATSAIAMLQKGTQVDLIITDYQMPGIGGLAFMAILREIAPSVPVIVLTGYGNEELHTKAMGLGAFQYLQKPVNLSELNRIVHAALDRRAND